MNLEELRNKYKFQGGQYEPKPDCKFCNGTGERKLKHRDTFTFCICLFVDHSMSDFAGDSLSKIAKELKEKL